MLSVIVPAYNEGKKIYSNLSQINDCLASFVEGDYEIVAVNDGSKDNTGSEISRAAADIPTVRPVLYDNNKGKGGAVIEGVKNSRGDLVAFIDADLDISPKHLEDFLRTQKETSCDVVIGSKMHKESKLEYPFVRKVFSIGFFCLLKILFNMSIKDTQTGLKLFKGDLIREIVPKQRVSGYAFDVEQLALASSMKATIVERPIEIVFGREESLGRIRFKDIWRMFTDTVSVWWNLRVKKNYK